MGALYNIAAPSSQKKEGMIAIVRSHNALASIHLSAKIHRMIREYIQAAMNHARYELLQEDGCYYGEIPNCKGVYASAEKLEHCRRELEEALEGWLLVRIARNMQIPEIDGLTVRVEKLHVA